MLIVRYCNKRGQIIDQITTEEHKWSVLKRIREEYGKADLIRRIGNTEYCLS